MLTTITSRDKFEFQLRVARGRFRRLARRSRAESRACGARVQIRNSCKSSDIACFGRHSYCLETRAAACAHVQILRVLVRVPRVLARSIVIFGSAIKCPSDGADLVATGLFNFVSAARRSFIADITRGHYRACSRLAGQIMNQNFDNAGLAHRCDSVFFPLHSQRPLHLAIAENVELCASAAFPVSTNVDAPRFR